MEASLRGKPNAIFERIQFCHDLELETVFPARIIRVNSDHTAYAQSLTKLENEIGECDCQPILVTTFWDFHGDFEVHHPLNVGDTGWLIGAVRDTSLVKQYNCHLNESENEGPQNSNNSKILHKSRFGFFFPDRWDEQDEEKQTVPEELQNCFYIQDRNGWCNILLDEDGRIAIKAKSSIEIFGDTMFNDDAEFKGDARFGRGITVDMAAVIKDLEVTRYAKFKDDVNISKSIFVDGDRSRINDMVEDELICVTNVEQTADKKTKLHLEKMKVLRSKKSFEKQVDITVPEGGGGGGTVLVDDRSIRFFDTEGEDKLEIKHFNDTTQDGTIPLCQMTSGTEDDNKLHSYYIIVKEYVNNVLSVKYIPLGAITNQDSAWSYSANTHKIKNCFVRVGRRWITAGNLDANDCYTVPDNFSGTIYAVVYHPNSSSDCTVSISTSHVSNDDEHTCIPIHNFNNGLITSSYVGAPNLTLYE